MEESKELQGFYKIFRAVIYISVLMEFFEYAIDPRAIDGFGGVVCDLHDRIKQWFIYHDGNLVYSKVVTFLLVCITCVGTRNKKHLEFDARRQSACLVPGCRINTVEPNTSIRYVTSNNTETACTQRICLRSTCINKMAVTPIKTEKNTTASNAVHSG